MSQTLQEALNDYFKAFELATKIRDKDIAMIWKTFHKTVASIQQKYNESLDELNK